MVRTKGLCAKHYMRALRHGGDIRPATRASPIATSPAKGEPTSLGGAARGRSALRSAEVNI
jgi:hypothetical protein